MISIEVTRLLVNFDFLRFFDAAGSAASPQQNWA